MTKFLSAGAIKLQTKEPFPLASSSAISNCYSSIATWKLMTGIEKEEMSSGRLSIKGLSPTIYLLKPNSKAISIYFLAAEMMNSTIEEKERQNGMPLSG